MQFYLRDRELNQLKTLTFDKKTNAKFFLITGSRKVGKTALTNKLIEQGNGIYITISSKSTAMQLKDISSYLRELNPAGSFIPQFENWKHLFKYFFMLGKEKLITVVLDEFHNLCHIDPNACNDLKEVWESHSSSSKLNLICVTFDLNFVKNTFHSENSPLYRMPNFSLRLSPFTLIDVVSIFKLNNSKLTFAEILDIYLIFGGYPKYYHLFDIFGLWDKNLREILKVLIFQHYAPLGNELKDIIVNLFTRENKVYISILQSIALNNHTLTEIAENINLKSTTIAKYLSELENKKHMIKRRQPINVSNNEKSKFGRYYISSYFENFWFRFVQPDIISYELGKFDRMLKNLELSFPEYRKERLPFLIRELMQHSSKIPRLYNLFQHDISQIGSIWNRKHLIDVIAFDDNTKEVLLGVVYTANGNIQVAEMEKILTRLKQFDKELVNYKTHKVIFHDAKINLDAGRLAEKENMKLCQLNKVFEEIYDNN